MPCCGDHPDPAGALRCAAIWCVVLSVLSGIIEPASICGMAVGCVLVGCCAGVGDDGMRQNMGCARCGSITGLVFAAIQWAGALILGAWFLGNVHIICDTADALLLTA